MHRDQVSEGSKSDVGVGGGVVSPSFDGRTSSSSPFLSSIQEASLAAET